LIDVAKINFCLQELNIKTCSYFSLYRKVTKGISMLQRHSVNVESVPTVIDSAWQPCWSCRT